MDASMPAKSSSTAAPCPLCHSAETSAVRTTDAGPVVELWRREFSIDVSPLFRGLSSFVLRECASCSIQFFSPEWLAGPPDLYSQLESQPLYYNPSKWEYTAALRDLPGASHILEVGCGFGDFVARAIREAGLDAEGLEQNESAVREAQRRGLPVRCANLVEEARLHPADYDAVCAFQVLEHVPNPGQFLESCCALLRPGGKLIIGVPNARSFLRYTFNPLDMPPHHMTRWTDAVIERIPHFLPLRLSAVRREPLADYHVPPFAQAYCSAWSARPGLRALAHPRAQVCVEFVLKSATIRRVLRGHTLYASFVRTSCPSSLLFA
jgi:SAM-dependent methyltransferase